MLLLHHRGARLQLRRSYAGPAPACTPPPAPAALRDTQVVTSPAHDNTSIASLFHNGHGITEQAPPQTTPVHGAQPEPLPNGNPPTDASNNLQNALHIQPTTSTAALPTGTAELTGTPTSTMAATGTGPGPNDIQPPQPGPATTGNITETPPQPATGNIGGNNGGNSPPSTTNGGACDPDDNNLAAEAVRTKIAQMKAVMTDDEGGRTTFGAAHVTTWLGIDEMWVAGAGLTGYVRPELRGDAFNMTSPAPGQLSDLEHINDAEMHLYRAAQDQGATINALGATRPVCTSCQERLLSEISIVTELGC